MSDEEYEPDLNWLIHEYNLKEDTSNQNLEQLDVCRFGEGTIIHTDKPFLYPVPLQTVGSKRFAENYSDGEYSNNIKRSSCGLSWNEPIAHQQEGQLPCLQLQSQPCRAEDQIYISKAIEASSMSYASQSNTTTHAMLDSFDEDPQPLVCPMWDVMGSPSNTEIPTELLATYPTSISCTWDLQWTTMISEEVVTMPDVGFIPQHDGHMLQHQFQACSYEIDPSYMVNIWASHISEQYTSVLPNLSTLDDFPSYSQDQLWADINIEAYAVDIDPFLVGSEGASHISEIQITSVMSSLSTVLDELPSYSQDQLWAEIDTEEEIPSFDLPSVTFLSSSYASSVETISSSTSTTWELEEVINWTTDDNIPALTTDDYQLEYNEYLNDFIYNAPS